MKKRAKQTVFFTGGGTGGHVYPGLAVIRVLQERGFFESRDLYWIGSSKGMERTILKNAGIRYIPLPAGKLRRYFSFRNFSDIFNISWAVLKSLYLMIRKRPVLLFSKGGYVSVPPVLAARLCRIPVITHESDLDPGLATRINSRFASRICISYDKTAGYFPAHLREKTVLTGNPIRPEVLKGDGAAGKSLFGLKGDKPLIFVIGGSLGASQINSLMEEIYREILPHAEIIHQTGAGNGEEIPAPGYVRKEYINEEIPHILSAADLVITRAGAGTLWECGTLGKAMILIPLDTSGSRGDQLRNAAYFQEKGAALVLEGEDACGKSLQAAVLELLSSPDKRAAMGQAAASLTGLSGSNLCAQLVEETAENESSRK